MVPSRAASFYEGFHAFPDMRFPARPKRGHQGTPGASFGQLAQSMVMTVIPSMPQDVLGVMYNFAPFQLPQAFDHLLRISPRDHPTHFTLSRIPFNPCAPNLPKAVQKEGAGPDKAILKPYAILSWSEGPRRRRKAPPVWRRLPNTVKKEGAGPDLPVYPRGPRRRPRRFRWVRFPRGMLAKRSDSTMTPSQQGVAFFMRKRKQKKKCNDQESNLGLCGHNAAS